MDEPSPVAGGGFFYGVADGRLNAYSMAALK
jgi:hypothetical protein